MFSWKCIIIAVGDLIFPVTRGTYGWKNGDVSAAAHTSERKFIDVFVWNIWSLFTWELMNAMRRVQAENWERIIIIQMLEWTYPRAIA